MFKNILLLLCHQILLIMNAYLIALIVYFILFIGSSYIIRFVLSKKAVTTKVDAPKAPVREHTVSNSKLVVID